MSKIFYKVLFNNYADQNDLFNLVPSENIIKQKLENSGYKQCLLPTCQPIQFFDFFSTMNYSREKISELLNQISDAWVIQNVRENDPLFKLQLVNDLYRIIPYISKEDQKKLIYRIFYAMGIKKNSLGLDTSDFYDPTDSVYNMTIKSIVPRDDYNQYIPSDNSALVVEQVDGVIIKKKKLINK